jgi:hypothetical protein
MKLIMALLFTVAVAGLCSKPRAQILAVGGNLSQAIPTQQSNANIVYIDQVGSYNTTTISQDGVGHYVSIVTGKVSAVDNTYVNVTQQGTGAKSVTVENPSGYNNSITTFQDGAGNHTAAIQNLNGAGNGFNISQTGAGTHSFTATGAQGTTNNGVNVTATQSGGAGTDKTFNLYLNGSSNVNVQIEQSNPNYPGQAGMAISCGTSCGTQPWTYISR